METPHSTQKKPVIRVATAGEALIDLIAGADGRLQPCLGGAVYNLTRALARQGVGTLYLNPLSKDRFGRQLAQGLLDDGVQLAAATPVPQPTSLAVVGLDEHGHPDYAFYRQGVADRATSAQALTLACAQEPALSLVCSGALALAPDDADIYLPWLQSQRAVGRMVVLDANLRPSVMPDLAQYRRHVRDALQYADLIKVSDEDLDCLDLPGADATQRARYLLRHSQARVLALSRGADGASLLLRSGQTFHARETQTLTVLDTVGAGDCFLAGLVTSLLAQDRPPDWGLAPVAEAPAQTLLGQAIASASLCVMRRGCVPPTRQEVQARLAQTTLAFSAG